MVFLDPSQDRTCLDFERVSFGVTDDSISYIENDGLSEGFRLLMLMAISFGCKVLEVSKDGEVWAGIPTYEGFPAVTTYGPQVAALPPSLGIAFYPNHYERHRKK